MEGASKPTTEDYTVSKGWRESISQCCASALEHPHYMVWGDGSWWVNLSVHLWHKQGKGGMVCGHVELGDRMCYLSACKASAHPLKEPTHEFNAQLISLLLTSSLSHAFCVVSSFYGLVAVFKAWQCFFEERLSSIKSNENNQASESNPKLKELVRLHPLLEKHYIQHKWVSL